MPSHTRRDNQVAVVVTLSNRTTYTSDEETAFRHIRHYLGRYDKYVLVPDGHPAEYPGFTLKPFPGQYFGSPQAHGSLLLSDAFYRAFLAYDYILIHHLDALVFRDELDDWCRQGYDYIGAPWLVSPDTPHITASKVGNGGLSLRRVASFLRVIDSRAHFVDPDEYWRRYCARTPRFQQLVNWPRKMLKRARYFNDVRWHIKWALDGDVHEDRFWAEYATHYDPQFRIAPVDVAMRFAFEAEPRRCFDRIGGVMPFGAHRWQKFDRAFFEPHLLRQGPGSAVRSAAPRASLAAIAGLRDLIAGRLPAGGPPR